MVFDFLKETNVILVSRAFYVNSALFRLYKFFYPNNKVAEKSCTSPASKR